VAENTFLPVDESVFREDELFASLQHFSVVPLAIRAQQHLNNSNGVKAEIVTIWFTRPYKMN
jgi:hypothetical protein